MNRRLFLLVSVAIVSSAIVSGQVASNTAQKAAPTPEFISAEQLKSQLAREQVTVIDVRDTPTYTNSAKIKGSIYIKLRRLSYRLTMPPLKNLPRDRPVVTYCACPHDEASIRARLTTIQPKNFCVGSDECLWLR